MKVIGSQAKMKERNRNKQDWVALWRGNSFEGNFGFFSRISKETKKGNKKQKIYTTNWNQWMNEYKTVLKIELTFPGFSNDSFPRDLAKLPFMSRMALPIGSCSFLPAKASWE